MNHTRRDATRREGGAWWGGGGGGGERAAARASAARPSCWPLRSIAAAVNEIPDLVPLRSPDGCYVRPTAHELLGGAANSLQAGPLKVYGHIYGPAVEVRMP